MPAVYVGLQDFGKPPIEAGQKKFLKQSATSLHHRFITSFSQYFLTFTPTPIIPEIIAIHTIAQNSFLKKYYEYISHCLHWLMIYNIFTLGG